jgi:hypothetical protein
MHNAYIYKVTTVFGAKFFLHVCVCGLLQTPVAPLHQHKRLLNPRQGGGAAQGSPLKKKGTLQQHHTLLGSSKALFSDAPCEHHLLVYRMQLLQPPCVHCAQHCSWLHQVLRHPVVQRFIAKQRQLGDHYIESALTCSDLMLQCL